MRTILEFCGLRKQAEQRREVTAESVSPHYDRVETLKGQGAEIILFPKLRRRNPKFSRKPLNRRFAIAARKQTT